MDGINELRIVVYNTMLGSGVIAYVYMAGMQYYAGTDLEALMLLRVGQEVDISG